MNFDDYIRKVEEEASEEELKLLEEAREHWRREAENADNDSKEE